MDLEEKVLETIKKYNLIEENDNVVIAVSGGPDSMALLHILYKLQKKLKIEISVAHVNHMLREEAKEETEFVKLYCEEHKIPCYIKCIDIKKEAEKIKVSTELAGRNLRYEFFEEISKKMKVNKIATAHNANDNAETVLMNIIRGSGITGLKGIEKKREEKYIRPIIECTREEIENYCTKEKLNPKYDKTNLENIYTRNKVRNLLIPLIKKEFNSNIIETLNRLSRIVENEEDFFVKVVENETQKIQIPVDKYKENLKLAKNEKLDMILNLKEFNKLDYVIKSRIIRYIINNTLGSIQGIEKIHVDDIIKLCQNNIGNKYLMPNPRIKIFIKSGKIFFISKLLD